MKKNKRKKYIIISIILITVIFIFLFAYYQNYSIATTYIEQFSDKLYSEFDNFKIIHLSDLHNTEFGKRNKNLIKIIKEEKPDAIFITGDYIDEYNTDLSVAVDLTKEISKISEIYYVTGNHEYSSGKYDKLKEYLLKYKVNILENNCITIKKNNKNIQVCGISDPSLVASYKDLSDKEILSDEINRLEIDKNEYNILLSHRPEHIELYAQNDFDLVFCGHSHGGQIILPFIGALYAPHQGVLPKYTTLAYTKKNTTMIVSRGLGNSIFPLRVFNRPEVIVATLKNR